MAATGNYTEEERQTILKMYEELGNEGLDQIAEKVNKSPHSIRAKLVREKVYKPVEKEPFKTKNGPSKKQLLRELEVFGVDPDGLEGATKKGLKAVVDFLKNKMKQEI